MDGRKNNGGHSTKPKNPNDKRLQTRSDLGKANDLMLETIRRVFDTRDDDEARIRFITKLLENPRGEMFIAEHLFGKPKETIETTHNINDFDIKQLFKFKD